MANPFIGRRVDVGIGRETSRGVGVAPSVSLPKANFTFEDKANKARSGDSLGHISGNGSQSVVTQRFSEGQIDGELNVNSFGLLLYALFGADTVTNPNGAYKHAFTLQNTNLHTSLSVQISNDIQDRIFENCMVDSLELNISRDDFVKYTVGLKGKKGQDSTFTPSYTTADYKFVGRDLVFKVASTQAGLAAASAVSVKELKLTIQKNAEHNFVLGTLEPEDIFNKHITVQGSVVLDYTDSVWKNYMLDGTYRALSILLNQSRDALGTNTAALYFELPVVDFSEWEPKYANDDIVTQQLNFTALYDTANSRLFSDAYIINMVAAY